MTTDMAEAHLVTGGSGFVALQLVAQLLEAGYRVNTTVRSLGNQRKVGPLKQLQAKHGEAKLKIFEADLLKPGSFAPAMEGCVVVHHVASPFKMEEQIKDGQKEMVEPALEGTRNVLKSVNGTLSVRRVVLTSTIGAIFGDYMDVPDKMKDAVLGDEYYNETSSVTHNPYHYSKVLAEKEAWAIHKAQDRWDMVTICPGLIIGPTLTSASESGSLFLLDELFKGRLWFGVPDLRFCLVDVRDVATAHIKAAENPDAKGRYIVCHKEMTHFSYIANRVRPIADRSISIPTHRLPSTLVRVIGPAFGLSQKWMSRNLGVSFTCDNERSMRELGITYRPLDESVESHYRSWLATTRAKK